VRAAIRGLALVLVLALAGCGQGTEREPLQLPEGRACQALEFDTVESVLGVRFDTTGSAQAEETYTCVLTRTDASLPDLTLSMASTTADELIFAATVTPSLSTPVTELGRIAYQVSLPPGSAADGTPTGPGLEIGWLSAAPRLMLLRYTWPVEATEAQVTELAPRLVDLARGIEQAVVAPAPPPQA
jgi:predicted small lipoprotein YifL